MKLHRFLLSTSVAVALLWTSARAAEQIFDVTGVIRGRLDDGQLVIQHDEIAGYMPAMTMAFAVSDPSEAARLKNGDRVRFRYRVNDTKSTAENFLVTGRETPPVVAGAAGKTKGTRVRPGDFAPAFSLVDQNDQPLAPAAFRDRLTVVTFIFTRCPVPEFCPAMALRFGELQRAILADAKLAGRARLLSITLDPEFDRPDILNAYGEAVGANPAVWGFATGTKNDIAALTKAFAVYNERNGVTLDHTLCTALIGADGRIIEIWRGNGFRTDEVLAKLREESAKISVAACCDVTK